MSMFWKAVDWISRATTLWLIVGALLSVWAYWEASTAGVPTHEIIFITVGTLALSLNVLFVVHHFLVWLQAR